MYETKVRCYKKAHDSIEDSFSDAHKELIFSWTLSMLC
jgi:hypothetical protein